MVSTAEVTVWNAVMIMTGRVEWVSRILKRLHPVHAGHLKVEEHQMDLAFL
jgi:hypothetical protein